MIFLYGATGVTGNLVAEALTERGIPLCLSGRDRSRLEALARRLGDDAEVRPARVHDASSLRAAMQGATVVVSCAGPFSKIGEPVLAAAIDSGAHYVDICGEQSFVRESYERYESRARRAGVAVVSALGFEVALGDFAASLAARDLDLLASSDQPLDEIAVAYAIDRLRLTPGTQRSIVQGLTRPGALWLEDRWEEVAPAAETRSFRFPPPFGARESLSFPSADVITIPRHIEARRVQAFLSLLPESSAARALSRAANVVSPLWPALMATPLGAFARSRAGASRPPSAVERADIRFAIVAEATRHFHRTRASVTGFDIYAVTAEACALGAMELHERPSPPSGVLSPSEAFDPEATLYALAERCGLEVERS